MDDTPPTRLQSRTTSNTAEQPEPTKMEICSSLLGCFSLMEAPQDCCTYLGALKREERRMEEGGEKEIFIPQWEELENRQEMDI